MPSDLYVQLSGQMAMESRLATIADNIANMRTAGYKAEVVNFDTVMSDYRIDSVSFAAVGEQHIEFTAGPLEPTGNPLDLAISGDGFFAIQTPFGTAYTRDGRMTVTAAGDLVSLTGHPVLDDGGAPMAIDPAAGPVDIALDGTMTQNGEAVGVVGLFALPLDAELTRVGDSAFVTEGDVPPVEDRVFNTVRQGYREGSNVNPIQALHHLITAQRAFEYAANATGQREDALAQAVRTLGAD